MAESVRVRIAPSPTGKFHLGTARTALFNYLFAKHHEGKFILRIEDTDNTRNSDEFVTDICEGMKWLGLDWDEGPEVGGPFGPYFQQERLHIYEEYTNQLLEAGKAYKCYCTTEELDAHRLALQSKGIAPKYSGRCRNLSNQEIDAFEREGRKPVIRFKVESQPVTFDDLVRGKITFDSEAFGDFVIVRSDGMPVFVFTNVIDDRLMEISHALRGEEHLSNTAKQILLNEALNFLSPQFGHFPLIVNPDHSKMSKRKDPVSVSEDYQAKGYLPEAINNFLVLLGWSSGTDQEIFNLEDLIKEFQIERVGKSPSVFDPEKLLWMNGYYIRHLASGELAERTKPFITNDIIQKAIKKDPEYYLEVIALLQDRLKLLDETESLLEFFYLEPQYSPDLLIAKKSTKDRTSDALKLAYEVLDGLKTFSIDETEVALRTTAKDHQLKDGEILWTVRVALTGRDASPGVFEMLQTLGKSTSLERITTARKKIAKLKK